MNRLETASAPKCVRPCNPFHNFAFGLLFQTLLMGTRDRQLNTLSSNLALEPDKI